MMRLLFGFSLLLLIACKRDDPAFPAPLLEPLPYLPVYPGSFWKYVDLHGDTTTKAVANEYVLDKFDHDGTTYIGQVPVWDGVRIWHYQERLGTGNEYPVRKLLSETDPIGTSWLMIYHQGTSIRRRIVAKDTVVNVLGTEYSPTIVVEKYYAIGPPQPTPITRCYYTRDIGLVMEELYTAGEMSNVRSLIDHMIQR